MVIVIFLCVKSVIFGLKICLQNLLDKHDPRQSYTPEEKNHTKKGCDNNFVASIYRMMWIFRKFDRIIFLLFKIPIQKINVAVFRINTFKTNQSC